MNKLSLSLTLSLAGLSAALGACGSDSEQAGKNDDTRPVQGSNSPDDFPPPAEGYTRFEAPVLKDIAPYADITVCQYVQAPLDHDVDIMDVQGHQSVGGHHAVAYSSRVTAAVGTSRECSDEDNEGQGGFLGGVGGEGGAGVELPPGVAFRLRKGESIMLNTHFINPTDKPIDGHSVVDFKFVEVDESRTIAALFANGGLDLALPANDTAEYTAECVLPKAMEFILFTNHMHEWGSSAITEVLRASGDVELIHEDPSWTYEMQFKAVYSKWTLEQPLRLEAGDTIRTKCKWKNTTDSEIVYPREMCFGVGFFLSDGKSSPACIDGNWLEI